MIKQPVLHDSKVVFIFITIVVHDVVSLTLLQKQFILTHEQEDVRNLALRFKGEDMPFLLNQIKGRQTAKNKIPSWYVNNEIVYPIQLSQEQASSEITAQYKVSVIGSGRILVDLTGGMGVDFSFLSPRFTESVYVEQNMELCNIAAHNFKALNLPHVSVQNTTSDDYLENMPPADVIYLDPARRNEAGKKTFRIKDCSPDVLEIRGALLTKAKLVVIKFSPMLDIALAVKELKYVHEVHVVSVENECKELLFLLSPKAESIAYHAVNLRKNGNTEKFFFNPQDEHNLAISFAETIGKYLYEPNASILKAGGFKSVAKQFGIQKLHVNSHLYTCNTSIPNFPGRIFEVKEWFLANKQNIKLFLSHTKKANVAVRNFPLSVAEIRQKTGLKEGGEVYLFA